jgi:hypothetical protein
MEEKMKLLIDQRITQLGAIVDRRSVSDQEPYWRITHAWVTINGNWDDVPGFAKPFQQDTLGGAHHAYCACTLDSELHQGAGFVLENGGLTSREATDDGWADFVIGPSGYDWKQARGPYSIRKIGNAEILRGVGLPYPPLPWQDGIVTAGGVHVSWFCIWQYTEPAVEPGPEPGSATRFRITGTVGPFDLDAIAEVES